MSDFFKNLYDAIGEELPSGENLPPEKKAAIVKRMRSRGFDMKEIAEHLGISVSYAYQLNNKALDPEKNDLECQTYFDTFMERRQMLMDQIDKYKKQQELFRCAPKSTEKDPETGEYKESGKQGSARDYAELGRLIQNYEKMLIQLEDLAGILPTRDNGNMFGSISDMNPEKSQDENRQLNDEEATSVLLQKLSNTTSSIKQSTLKNLKDEKVL